MKLLKFCILFLSVFSLSAEVIDREVSFSEWRDFCFQNLEEFDHLMDAIAPLAVLRRAYDVKEAVSHNEFYRALVAAQNCIAEQMSDSRVWLEGVTLDSSMPFMQQMIVDSKSRVYIQGDIHGSVHSLLRNLDRVCANGYLNDDFKLSDNVYMVFLGDYGDRGRYSVEVLYTLFRLKAVNPDKVILLAGNHEDVAMAHAYGLVPELAMKYGVALSEFFLKALGGFFEHLPSLCWVGASSPEGMDYIGGCHALPTLGFDMTSFLKKPDCRFARLTFDPVLKERQLSLFDDAEQVLLRDAYEKKDQDPASYCSEFSWADISHCIEYKELRGRSLAFPVRIVQRLLNSFSSSSDQIFIKAFFRGHQHIQGNGCFDTYEAGGKLGITLKRVHQESVFPVINTPVFTLISAPEGVGLFETEDKDSFSIFDFATKNLCMLDYLVPGPRVARMPSGNRYVGAFICPGRELGVYRWDMQAAYQKRIGEKRVVRDDEGPEVREGESSHKRDKQSETRKDEVE